MGCGQSQQAQDGAAAKPVVQAAPVNNKAKAPKEFNRKMKVEEKPRESRLAAYNNVKAKLPSDRSEASVEKRKEMFHQWDVNGNGKLSLAEIDKACREQLELENVTANLEPILIRAYYAAVKKDDDDDGFIEFKEFRILFEFIGIFFELMFLFEELETDADRRITEAEFMKNEDKLKQYGIDFPDAKAAFVEMAGGEGQMVLFEEFCDYCTRHKLAGAGAQAQKKEVRGSCRC